jgi:hypothetical protein
MTSCREDTDAQALSGGQWWAVVLPPGRPTTARFQHHLPVEPIPAELFLEGFPPGIREAAERLRDVVREAVPDTMERVRTGWRLIGYDVPAGKRSRYFAFVAPELEHVHLGFEYGVSMADPDNLLQGAHLNLRKVRFVTYEPGDPIPESALAELTRDAARLAIMSRAERLARELDRPV